MDQRLGSNSYSEFEFSVNKIVGKIPTKEEVNKMVDEVSQNNVKLTTYQKSLSTGVKTLI